MLDRYFKRSILQVHRRRVGDYLIATGNDWWRVDGRRAIGIRKFSMTRPMNRGICESTEGTVYVAEYMSNTDRAPVHVFKSKDLENFEIAWTFPPNCIRHVHALVPDPFKPRRIWILTGDLDFECHFFYTDDDFVSVQSFLSAGQLSRATDMVFRNDAIYWGMDSPDETSWIVKVRYTDPSHPEKICELPGPPYYFGMDASSRILLGTTVEPGRAVKDRFARVYQIDETDKCSEILRLRKDWSPQFGILYFPKGVLPAGFVVYSQRALVPYEGFMTILRRREDWT